MMFSQPMAMSSSRSHLPFLLHCYALLVQFVLSRAPCVLEPDEELMKLRGLLVCSPKLHRLVSSQFQAPPDIHLFFG